MDQLFIYINVDTSYNSNFWSCLFRRPMTSLIPAWMSNNIHYTMWGEITYPTDPFPNFNGAAVEIWNG